MTLGKPTTSMLSVTFQFPPFKPPDFAGSTFCKQIMMFDDFKSPFSYNEKCLNSFLVIYCWINVIMFVFNNGKVAWFQRLFSIFHENGIFAILVNPNTYVPLQIINFPVNRNRIISRNENIIFFCLFKGSKTTMVM